MAAYIDALGGLSFFSRYGQTRSWGHAVKVGSLVANCDNFFKQFHFNIEKLDINESRNKMEKKIQIIYRRINTYYKHTNFH